MAAQRTPRITVAIEIDDLSSEHTAVVLSAACQLFGPQDPVDVVLSLSGIDEPSEAHGRVVQALCLSATANPGGLPEILLVGTADFAARVALIRVRVGHDAAAAARAVVLLGATAQQVWDLGRVPETVPVTADRSRSELAIARRDVRSVRDLACGSRRPTVVLVFQHRNYWGAVATLCSALAARTEVRFEVVALDSTADGGAASTTAFLLDQGVSARTPGWFASHRDQVDLVVFDNPYDEFRPPGLRVPDLVAAGIRVAAVPYGCNTIGGELMDALHWDLPLQRLAWRFYLGSETQAKLFSQHCATGSSQVRVMGSPKLDRIVLPASRPQVDRWRELAGGRPIIVWNPHFRVGPGGWSTFLRYVQPLTERFQRDSGAVLLIRPHFRLFRDLGLMGSATARIEPELRETVATSSNILLDESPDYLDALLACDAMLSDLSSLATELMPSGKPILYLHRADGPGVNSEGAHFAAMDRADTFADIEAFLDRVLLGQDPMSAARRAASESAFPHADGHAGERVADDLIVSLLDELGEHAVPALRSAPHRGARVA